MLVVVVAALVVGAELVVATASIVVSLVELSPHPTAAVISTSAAEAALPFIVPQFTAPSAARAL
jgi:hypothetical protein